jgi:Xaa-Pro dipeptidase
MNRLATEELVRIDTSESGWESQARLGRHARLREHMAEMGISTLVSTSFESFAYLTATWCSAYPVVPTRRLFAVITSDDFFVVSSSADPAHLREKEVEDVVIYTADVEDPAEALLRALRHRNLMSGTIALELPELDTRVHAALAAGIEGHATEVDGWPALWRTRVLKDPWELSELRRLGEVMAEGSRLAASQTRAGDTEIDFARRANDYAFDHEAVDGGVVTMGSGERAAVHHTAPTHRRLQAGDIVRIDVSRRGPLGYFGDIGRTLFVGQPGREQEERFHVLAAGLTAIEEGLLPGRRIGDAALACGAVFEDAGFGRTFSLHGHGIGLTLHEDPVIEPACDIICEPDMVFAAEAILKIGYDPATFTAQEAYHLESLVQVTETGNEVMATAGKDVLTIPT